MNTNFETKTMFSFDLLSSKVFPQEKIPLNVMFHLLNKSGQLQLQRKEEQGGGFVFSNKWSIIFGLKLWRSLVDKVKC